MDTIRWAGFLSLFCAMMLLAVQGFAGEAAEKKKQVKTGMLEIECNISRVDLHLCPEERYRTKEKSVLFGLIKSEKYICSGEEVFLGETPVKPVSVPTGKYILMIPKGYHSKHDGPIEIDIAGGERKFLLLKLFSTRADGRDDDHGAGGGGGAGGAGAGGGAGAAPPD